ncbi:globin isoform X2 [Pectinophora gossypiella]|nr:globin isoform X2 [Pectinophora gossypiella]XP_049869221.1 globin isoform X2 [Pectinophora gossypiella]
MGSIISYVYYGGDPDVVNPVSGLSRREVHLVQKSWAPVTTNLIPNGIELLKRFFRAYPETKNFFKMIRNTPEEEFANNAQFKAHVVNLMTSLTSAVDNLNNPEVVAAMMHKIGESHGKRKIQEKHYIALKGVIVNMFIELLKMDSATLSAWDKTVDFWYKNIFQTLNCQDTSDSR